MRFKTGFAAAGFIEKLQKEIPHIKDILGEPVLFDTYKFELIESALDNQLLHQVAIHYITPIFTLHEIIGNNLLLSIADKNTVPADTFMVKMQAGFRYQTISHCNFE